MNRHLQIRYESVKKNKDNDIITLLFVHSNQNITDNLTKGLNKGQVINALRGMRLKPI